MESKEKISSVKIWEVRSDNSAAGRDSSDESETDEFDSLRPIRIFTVAPPRFLLFVFFDKPL